MKQNLKSNNSGPNRLMTQLVAEKKKGIMALCLIALMVFMWARVLGKKTPESAEAAVTTQDVSPDKSGTNPDSLPKISFVELPKVEGRNEVLTRDFFTVDDWKEFIRDGKKSGDIEGVNVASEDGFEKVVRRVAGKLKLEAIVFDENPHVFVNDKLLSVGDKLLVRDGVDTYECEIVGIEEYTVFIRCGEAEIVLKLTQAIEVTD